MTNEYHFTFCRWTPQGPEENSDSADFASFDEAMKWADDFCKRHNCRVKQIEWFDPELNRWQNSQVAYT